MTPAPTTAALNTNMGRTLAAAVRRPLQVRLPLAGEARDGAAQRRGHARAHGDEVDRPREGVPGLELVLQREADLGAVVGRLEGDAAAAAQPLVLDLELLTCARLVGD